MIERSVGQVMNITYDTNTKTMRVMIDITDDNFKEEILRNQELKNKIKLIGDNVMYVAKKDAQ